jgi:hypothetical protein
LASGELGLGKRGSNENVLSGYDSEAAEKSGNEFHDRVKVEYLPKNTEGFL